jgi:hypothetical protein
MKPDPLDPRLRALLDAERVVPPLDEARQRGLFERLSTSIAGLGPGASGDGGDGSGSGEGGAGGGGGGGGAAAAPSLGAGAKTLLGKPLLALALAAGAGGAVGASVDHAIMSGRPPRVVVVERAAPAAASTAASSTTAPPEVPVWALPSPSVTPTARPTVTAQSPTSEPASDATMAEERVLVELARAALARQDGAGALDAVERHKTKYPRGQLAEERELIAVQALATLGRKDDARARARAFRRSFPASILRPAVDDAAE